MTLPSTEPAELLRPYPGTEQICLNIPFREIP